MGADIYLNSVYDPHHASCQPAFKRAVAARDAKYPRDSVMPEDCPEQKAVTAAYDDMLSRGYFRDSYNATSLFGFLGLSWWASADPDTYPWSIDGEGHMSVPSMRALKARLEQQGEVTCQQMQEWAAIERHITIDDDKNSLTSWGRMFERKRRKLIHLLGEAITLNEPLYCSC